MQKSGFGAGLQKSFFELIELDVSKVTVVRLLEDTTHMTNDIEICLGFQEIKQHIRSFFDTKACIEQLRGDLNRGKVTLLISRNSSLNEDEMTTFCDMLHIESIYQFNSDNPCRKLGGTIIKDLDQLTQVESDFHFIPPDVTTISIEQCTDLTKFFLMNQILLELLQKVPCQPGEKDKMIAFLNSEFYNQENRLEHIRKYRDSNPKETAISCYTGGSCISHILNKTLREKRPTSMIKMHYLNYGLYSKLVELYNLQKDKELKSLEKIYRSKTIPKAELHRFQCAIGQFVITNSYVSTSRAAKNALVFSDEKAQGSNIPVLFSMKLTAQPQSTRPMALPDKKFLKGNYEDEILLSAGIVFYVQSVRKGEKNIWKIKLIRSTREELLEKDLCCRVQELITTINSTENTLFQLKTLDGRELVDEYRYAITNIQERTKPSHEEFPSFPQLSEPSARTNPISNRSMQPWRAFTRSLSSYSRVIILAFAVLLILVLVLTVVLPLVLIKQHATVATTSAPGISSTLNHLVP